MSTNLPVTPADSSAPVGPASARGRWIVLAIAVGLVVVPLLWTEGPAEIGRWYCAAAAEAELDGDLALALQKMDRAIAWGGKESNLYAYRASLKLQAKDLDGALADCDRAISLAPEGSMYAVYQRVLVNQRRGDHGEALKDIEKIMTLASDDAPPQRLPSGQVFVMPYDATFNLRAYARALAEREIPEGLEDIKEAFRRAGTEEVAAYLDTRGYLRYLAGDLPAAEDDLQRAVALAEKTRAAFEDEEPAGDLRVWNRQGKLLQEELAVLLQHRGLVFQAQGRADEAAADFRRAQEYGFNPEEGVW